LDELRSAAVTSIGGRAARPAVVPVLRPDPVVRSSIAPLRTDLGLRAEGIRSEHVATLAELREPLPPIVVHRDTMRIVDGLHRVRAAQARGESHILVCFIDGTDIDALVAAISLNRQHGLPLSRRDRRGAVERLLTARPQWSDRRIAALAGVDHKTVGSVRRRATGEIPHMATVVGIDGRVRARRGGGPFGAAGGDRSGGPPEVPAGSGEPVGSLTLPAPAGAPSTMEALRADPSLCYTAVGRTLLRLSSATLGLRDPDHLAAAAPPHRRTALASVARLCADRWLRVADALDLAGPPE
jgi:ParB-like nuclease domain